VSGCLEKRLNKRSFLESDDRHAFLKSEILQRLHLPAIEEDNLMNLVVLSVKLQTTAISEKKLLESVDKYDCHQIGLVAKKKALLLLGIEKDLEVCLDDDEAVEAKTVKDLCALILEEVRRKETA
jgi:hypothetical protein